MLHAGLDLSRRRLDVCLLSEEGELLEQTAIPPDADGLRALALRFDHYDEPIRAAVESMTGARYVHDTLEDLGWDVLIADAEKVKPFGSVACKTDKIDAAVLAHLSQLALIPEIWLPDPRVRELRELARFRMHLVKHRSTLKHRIHATLMSFGKPCTVTDLFGAEGRRILEKLEVPEPWRSNVTASLRMMDELDREIASCNSRLAAGHGDHPYIPLLQTVPGIGKVLAFTIAAEIGDIDRFPTAKQLTGYSGLCPRVNQSGDKDRRGPLTKNGPRYLRWALIEATMHASRHSAYADRYQRNKKRLGKQRGAKVAQIDVARKLTVAIWHMLTRNEEFSPRGATSRLAA